MKPFDNDAKNPHKKCEVIFSKPWDYSLIYRENKIFLHVESSRAGMYPVSRELSRDEMEEYKLHGPAYLDKLAGEVRGSTGNQPVF